MRRRKQEEIEFFNQQAEEWTDNISDKAYQVVEDLIEKLEIGEGDSVLDAAAGTGILYSYLKDKGLSNYVAVDIAEKMVEEFLTSYPEADVRCADFESRLRLEDKFDFVITFNSSPHFYDLDMVFKNAYHNLNLSGKFVIAHSTTREKLKAHHKKNGYDLFREEAIPRDKTLHSLADKYKFDNIIIEDSNYFMFKGEKQEFNTKIMGRDLIEED